MQLYFQSLGVAQVSGACPPLGRVRAPHRLTSYRRGASPLTGSLAQGGKTGHAKATLFSPLSPSSLSGFLLPKVSLGKSTGHKSDTRSDTVHTSARGCTHQPAPNRRRACTRAREHCIGAQVAPPPPPPRPGPPPPYPPPPPARRRKKTWINCTINT